MAGFTLALHTHATVFADIGTSRAEAARGAGGLVADDAAHDARLGLAARARAVWTRAIARGHARTAADGTAPHTRVGEHGVAAVRAHAAVAETRRRIAEALAAAEARLLGRWRARAARARVACGALGDMLHLVATLGARHAVERLHDVSEKSTRFKKCNETKKK